MPSSKLLLKILVRLFILRSKTCFHVIIDESKDAAKQEKLDLAVRYSTGHVVEIFLYLGKLDQLSAQAIKECLNEMINCIIQSSGGSILVCLGADGVSVMAGKFTCVEELLGSE
ncbi:unnamed protein product [Lepeophtheirus salmonis]|uniref:(salmon louse) hypothetical protein n=1 Tax=Lepeophtheirus salmonis TaxID=72036 RepID=A0A7R8H861_LEPSM|nr:unnamed protein product [Lepeophtheirus salmonis]CAF2917005.1 unnamed protein product [Lepeophtheirus salmonis]